MHLTVEHKKRKYLLIYGTILAIITFLSLKIYFILDKALKEQKHSAYIINLSGRQRMLSQLIVIDAANYRTLSSEEHANALETSITEMEKAHIFLTTQENMSKETENYYFSPLHIDADVKKYLNLSKEILAEHDKITPYLELQSMSRHLLSRLDSIVFSYQDQAQKRTQEQHFLQLALLLLILALLILKILLVFIPIIRKSDLYFRMASKDALTNINNRRFFIQANRAEHKRCERYKNNYALCLIDIDYFKKINDEHGHPTGDIILKKVAQVIQKEIRTNDHCARIGGEEFSVLLVDSDQKSAHAGSEKIRKSIECIQHYHKSHIVSVTVSIGIAVYSPDEEKTIKEMYEQADTALYAAKQAGRNNSKVWDKTMQLGT